MSNSSSSSSKAMGSNQDSLQKKVVVAVPMVNPKWVSCLLQEKFGNCSFHTSPKNELNKFCIDCESTFCLHCETSKSHPGHQVLKIYRHLYKEAILHSDLEKFLDCSDIQYYRCNQQQVIALEPRPNGGTNPKDQPGCEICQWRLMDPTMYKYCSLSCKVDAYIKKIDSSSPPFLTLEEKKNTTDEQFRKATHIRCHRRKGIPYRAPTREDPYFIGTISLNSPW